MPLVRCPIHKIPYNDENPRGCPACAREREGGDQAELMRELARMSQAVQQPPEAVTQPPGRRRSTVMGQPAAAAPVTEQPRLPPQEPGRLSLFWQRMVERRIVTGAAVVIVFSLLGIILTSGPDFVEGADPPVVTPGRVRPLPIEPSASVTTVFAVLGTETPRAVDGAPRLARYTYGDGLFVDALNQAVYAVTSDVPGWSWRGLRVGLEERTVRGALALLGLAEELPAGQQPGPVMRGRYKTFPSLEQRPTRTLTAAVRPPNGCFDVLVELKPRAAGVLVHGASRFAVIGEGHTPLEWTSTRVRIVDRAVTGPYGTRAAACGGG